jgi:hypothetical protein
LKSLREEGDEGDGIPRLPSAPIVGVARRLVMRRKPITKKSLFRFKEIDAPGL